jgi:flagellar hook protein FlgE
MLSSLYSGISGLLANSNSINVASNNIANVNTIGYKTSRTTFEDALYQSISSASGEAQVGRGTALSTVDTSFKQGSFETTTEATDLAIGGEGFFIVKSADSDKSYYTRAGKFNFDEKGNMTNANGYVLQGREIDSATGSPVGVSEDIVISSEPSQPIATKKIGMAVNLQADSSWAGKEGTLSGTGTSISKIEASSGSYPRAGDYTAALSGTTMTVTVAARGADGELTGDTTTYNGTVAAGTTYANWNDTGISFTTAASLADGSQAFKISGFDIANTSSTTNYSSPVTVYDSLGQSHIANIYFRKSYETDSGQNVWEWAAVLNADDSATGVATLADWGELTFNNSGVLVDGGDKVVSFDFSQGAVQNQEIELAFNSESGGGASTQYTIASTTNFQAQDGYPPGSLESLSINEKGVISGSYSNGQSLNLYQITLANFNNPNGLKKEGSSMYTATVESGHAYTNAAGEGGLGTISSNSLEQSNVDLATEFVNLIVAQRAYQASSRVITTTDEVLQELMNLKR